MAKKQEKPKPSATQKKAPVKKTLTKKPVTKKSVTKKATKKTTAKPRTVKIEPSKAEQLVAGVHVLHDEALELAESVLFMASWLKSF